MDEHQSLMFDDPESTVRRRALNVVRANAESVAAFDLSYFAGYRSMKALTYTTSIPMIADLVARQDFEDFECVFGHGGIVSREAASILSFQTVARERLSNAIIGIRGPGAASKSAIQQNIYQRVAEGEVRFFVVKDSIAHAKIYLLEGDGKRRVIVGSANLSERAFSGRQAETLVVFDDDETAWNPRQM